MQRLVLAACTFLGVAPATMGLSASRDVPAGRTFNAAEAKGGVEVDPSKTALVLIEYQNEFATEGGKMYEAVAPNMESTGMLAKSAALVAAARAKGMKILHCPISFAADGHDNPNPKLGILKGCADGALFVEGTWNAAICDAMKPVAGDLFVTNKKGLDAFPGTNLEQLLVDNGIETVVISGFLTNCCVESTMRTAYEKGFNTITLTDCCATTSIDGHSAATGGTFGLFSTPMTAAEFQAQL
ncbi:Isochorismatase-like protein [Pelagophyceae sp. CCMP2097]|nr:Isochorismatase-like protein [Pelagophyceae sp. CCMP2097]